MKQVFCPKCDKQLTFDEKKYPEGKALVFVCPQCREQFKVSGKEMKYPDFSNGYITVIENNFGFKQEFPLVSGDNVIGRKNKDTGGVDVPIVTSDPSMGRKHCIINVAQTKEGKRIHTLRDFPSLTGTFLKNTLLGKKEQVRIEEGDIITIGATTFIFHEASSNPHMNIK